MQGRIQCAYVVNKYIGSEVIDKARWAVREDRIV